MTQEEKAKAYDEAIERANELLYVSDKESLQCKIIESILPKLKESEDESMVKFIKKQLFKIKKTITENYKFDAKLTKAIDWLEEKGEHNTAWSEEDETGLGDALWAIQQARTIAKDENDMGNLWYAESWLKSLKDRCLPQPKQEWSKEDEDDFKYLMDEIVCLGNSRNSANRLHYDRLIKFLDELKNRIQPREEWCDKDERMLDRLIAYFEKRVAFTDEDNPRYANWLKSLRPQNKWKPSDEQMAELRKYSDNPILRNLYYNLKK